MTQENEYMRNLISLLQREPAAIGTLLASVLPALVLVGVLDVDETAVAGLVVAVNAVVGFALRLTVSPTRTTT
jgi:hypothetical protein